MTDDNGKPWQVSTAADVGVAEGVSSDDLTMRVPCDPDERGSAAEWMRDELADHREHLVKDVQSAALKARVGSRTTLHRAARSLGVVSARTISFPSVGTWRLPKPGEPSTLGTQQSGASPPASLVYVSPETTGTPEARKAFNSQRSGSRSTVVPNRSEGTTNEPTAAPKEDSPDAIGENEDDWGEDGAFRVDSVEQWAL